MSPWAIPGIQPGPPDQNAFVERFNRSYREDDLDAYVFASIDEVQGVTDEGLEDYTAERAHDRAVGRKPGAGRVLRYEQWAEPDSSLVSVAAMAWP